MPEKILTVSGMSMRPLLSPGDRAAYRSVERPSDLRRGEIAVLLRLGENGASSMIIHRVIGWRRGGSVPLTKGDACWRLDADPEALIVVGRLSAVCRESRWFSIETRRMRLWWWALSLLSPAFETGLHLFLLLERLLIASGDMLFRSRMPRAAWFALAQEWSTASDRWLKIPITQIARRATEALLSPRAPAPHPADAPLLHSGSITRDTVWNGEVLHLGDLLIAPGATLTLTPGTRLTLSTGGRFWPFFRAGLSQWRQVEDWGPKIVVFGNLRALGKPDSPIRISGKDWAGVHFANASRKSTLSHVELAGGPRYGLAAWDRAAFTARHCRIRARSCGLAAFGRSRLSARNCSVESIEGTALLAADQAAAFCRETSLRAEGPAVRAQDKSMIRLRSCRARSRTEESLLVQGDASVSGARLILEGRRCVRMSAAGSTLRLSRCVLNGAEAGLTLASGRAELSDCRVRSSRGHGAQLGERTELNARRCRLSGNSVGIQMTRSRLRLTESLVRSKRGAGIAAFERSDIRAKQIRILSDADAVEMEISSASLERASLESRSRCAVTVHWNSRLDITDSTLRGRETGLNAGRSHVKILRTTVSANAAGGTGVVLADESRLSMNSCSLSADTGINSSRSRVEMLRTTVSADADEGSGVILTNESRLSMSSCSLRAGAGGIRLDRSHLLSIDSRITARLGTAVHAARKSRIELHRSTALSALEAARLEHSDARIERTLLVSSRHMGLSAEGRSRILGLRVRIRGASAAVRLRDSYARWTRSRISGKTTSLIAEGSEIEIRRSLAEGRRGLDLASSRLSVRGGELRSTEETLLCRASRVVLEDSLLVSREKTALTAAEESHVESRGTLFRGGTGSIRIGRGCRLAARRSVFLGREFGLDAAASSSVLRSVSVRGGRCSGINLRGGSHDFKNVSLEACPPPGLTADDSAELRYSRVLYRGAPWARPALWVPPPAGGALRRILLEFVLRTRGWAPLRLLYRGIYSAAAARLARAARRSSGIASLIAYRSWTAGGWQAGLSDLDLHVVLRGAENGIPAARGFHRVYHSLKRLAPFLGELVFASEAETHAYVREGGVRAREFQRHARPLTGSFRSDPAAGTRKPVTDLTEALHSYTKLLQIRYPALMEPAQRRMENAKKAYLGVIRCGSSDELPSAALPRPEFLSWLAERRPETLRRIQEAERMGRSDPRAAVELLCRDALGILSRTCDGLLDGGADPAGYRRLPPARMARRGRAGIFSALSASHQHLAEDGGEAVAGLCLQDSGFLFVVFEGEPGERCWRALENLRARRSFLRLTPMVLTRRVWDFAVQSPYQHHPTHFLDFARGEHDISLGTAGFTGPHQYAVGELAVARRLGQRNFDESARQSLLHLGLCWRSRFLESSRESASQYLYSRALGLRLLLEKKVLAPFSDLEALRRAAAEHFPDTRDWLERLELTGASETDWERHGRFLARQINAARASLSPHASEPILSP